MMRSLWTAASGMIGQQSNLDVIANNLSNIDTTGYKTQQANFKSLIYQNMQKKTTTSTGQMKPVGALVGLGVRMASVSSDFTQGALNASNGEFDYAIQGDGFFMIRQDDGSTAYTRNGHFNISIQESTENSTTVALTDSSGHQVLDTAGNPISLKATNQNGRYFLEVNGNQIELANSFKTSNLKIDQYGSLSYPDATNNYQSLGATVGLAYFPNASGLEKVSDSNYLQTDASGQPTLSAAAALNSKIVSGYLESSNVQAADEMVNMIVAQRAYEMNSKAITASDEMLQQANNLRS